MVVLAIIIGAFLFSYLLDAAYRHLWEKNLEIVVKFQEHPAMEGQEAFLTETIINRKWLFLPMLQVGFQIHRNLVFADGENTSVSDQCYKRDIFSVGSFQKITRTIPFRCSKRGYYELNSIELVTRNPLLTAKYYETLKQKDWMYVYPRMIDDRRLDISFQKIMGEVLSQKRIYEDPFEFRGIREYQPTDPLSKMNWKASARSDQWMVNLYGSTCAQEIILLLDLEDETIWKYDDIHEEQIRLTASLAARFIASGISVGIQTNGKDIKTGERLYLPPGSGNQQILLMNEGLSRLDLLKKSDPMEQILDREREKLEYTQRTYIMISKNQRISCYEGFLRLLHQGTSGIWISTRYHDMEWVLPKYGNLPVLYWEVEK